MQLQYCNYGGVHLNTADKKILAENFILPFSRQTWLGIIQDKDAIIENVSATESNSELRVLWRVLHRVLEGTSESKSDNDDDDENVPFYF